MRRIEGEPVNGLHRFMDFLRDQNMYPLLMIMRVDESNPDVKKMGIIPLIELSSEEVTSILEEAYLANMGPVS